MDRKKVALGVLGGLGMGVGAWLVFGRPRPGVQGEGIVTESVLGAPPSKSATTWGEKIVTRGAGDALLERRRAQTTVASAAAPKWAVDRGYYGRGYDMHRVTRSGEVRPHAALDISAGQGTPIRALAAGVVERAETVGGYGNHLVVRHLALGGVATHYAHCHRLRVGVGDVVLQGQHIADVGATGFRDMGAHLHMSVLDGLPSGSRVTTDIEARYGLDPVPWMTSHGVAMVQRLA